MFCVDSWPIKDWLNSFCGVLGPLLTIKAQWAAAFVAKCQAILQGRLLDADGDHYFSSGYLGQVGEALVYRDIQ